MKFIFDKEIITSFVQSDTLMLDSPLFLSMKNDVVSALEKAGTKQEKESCFDEIEKEINRFADDDIETVSGQIFFNNGGIKKTDSTKSNLFSILYFQHCFHEKNIIVLFWTIFKGNFYYDLFSGKEAVLLAAEKIEKDEHKIRLFRSYLNSL